MLQLVIDGDTPSQKNSKEIRVNRATGARFVASNARVKAWQTAALWQLKSVVVPEWDYPVAGTFVFYFSNKRRHDLDNCVSTVLDVLVKAEIIKGDDYTCIAPLTLDFGGVEEGKGRVEIWLE